MYNTYDEYLAANEPKYKQTCPCCGRVYYSNDGYGWFGDDTDYNYNPVQGGQCIECESEAAAKDPASDAAKEILCQPKHLKELLAETINMPTREAERNKLCYKLLELLLTDEDFKTVAEDYARYEVPHDIRSVVESISY